MTSFQQIIDALPIHSLKDICKKVKIPNYSKKNREQLLAMIASTYTKAKGDDIKQARLIRKIANKVHTGYFNQRDNSTNAKRNSRVAAKLNIEGYIQAQTALPVCIPEAYSDALVDISQVFYPQSDAVIVDRIDEKTFTVNYTYNQQVYNVPMHLVAYEAHAKLLGNIGQHHAVHAAYIIVYDKRK